MGRKISQGQTLARTYNNRTILPSAGSGYGIGDYFYEKGDIFSVQDRSMKKKQITAIFLALWLLIISYFMLLVGRFELALFFILGFIGFLVIVEITEPNFVRPAYLRYVKYLIVAGTAIFGAVIIQKVMEILGLYFTWSF
jgi:hypothetical protein